MAETALENGLGEPGTEGHRTEGAVLAHRSATGVAGIRCESATTCERRSGPEKQLGICDSARVEGVFWVYFARCSTIDRASRPLSG
jgi:hypothetical protein